MSQVFSGGSSGGGSGANQTLSNLTSPTSINQSLLFVTDATYTIGAQAASRPSDIYNSGNHYTGTYPYGSGGAGFIGMFPGGSGNFNATIQVYSGGGPVIYLNNDTVNFNIRDSAGYDYFTTGKGVLQQYDNANNIKFGMDSGSNVYVGNGALATTATSGFLYIPTMAGAPTGTPTSKTGLAPMVLDTTNGKFWMYYGGAWHYTTMT